MVEATYSLDDPRPIAKEAPYTFFLPSVAEVEAVRPGDRVKLIFRPIPQDREYDAERMWVEVVKVDPNGGVGVLMNHPTDMPQLKPGMSIPFELYQIVDVQFSKFWRAFRFRRKVRGYWKRCLVDQCVLDDGVLIQYLYREKPDMGAKGDRFPDSGWRIRGDYRGLSDDELEARESCYVALGAVLNKDDTWFSLIDAPIGSGFLRNFDTGEFLPEKPES